MQDIKAGFNTALEKAMSEAHSGGIGTLGEKTLHSFIKHLLEPDTNKQEVKIGRYVADIADAEKITEIQTRAFNSMRKKLEYFLENGYDVTVVHPLAERKMLCWLDMQTGEASKKRKSPKKMSIHDAFLELYKIKSFLTHKNLHFRFILLELTEYRNLDGWSDDGKKGSTRFDRIPSEILGEIYIDTPSDFKKHLPEGLGITFTSKDYAKCAGVNLRRAQTALNVLKYLGAVEEAGKEKNSILYKKSKS